MLKRASPVCKIPVASRNRCHRILNKGRLWEPLPHFSIIGIVATLVGGYPIFKEALESLFERRMTMELSMTIALAAALLVGEFFTALGTC
jgi:cation transport ATPase